MKKIPSNDQYANWNNRRHKIPSPEDLTVNTLYTFNYNPQTQPLSPQFKLDLITFHNGIDQVFKNLKYSKVKMNLELSSGSRWHYHGSIIIHDIMKFYIYDLQYIKENAAIEIDTIECLKSWETYCTKQKDLMKPICQEYGIPYTYENDKLMKVKINPLNDTKFCELIKLCPTSDYTD